MNLKKLIMGIFEDSIQKKDKSTVSFLIGCLIILFFVVVSVISLEKEKLLAITILASGVAVGWFIGILVSPMTEYNNEAANFAKVQQLLSTFITGALAVKFFQWVDGNKIQMLFENFELLSRILYFIAVTIFAAIIVYYERVYLDDQDTAKITFRNNGIGPAEVSAISIDHVNDLLRVNITNKGQVPLRIIRADTYDPECLTSEPIPGQLIDVNSKPQDYIIKSLSPIGKFLFVVNPGTDKNGRFKLRKF